MKFAACGFFSFATFLNVTSVICADSEPRVRDPRFQIEVFAEAPEIVTPIGATFTDDGQLLVIESHTHQRPQDYQGPEKDRIRMLSDTDGDGRADQFDTFFEGTEFTMSLETGPDGWIYVATRMEVFRLRDRDGDGHADQRMPIVGLETDGNYPHNGLSGLAIDQSQNLYFGMGENLGEDYVLVGSDGRRQSGSGEGGVFRCDFDGRNLQRVATGFWNPFGITVDPYGRLFAVGNDADGRPPCRLVHVVETGDYGFQFRYGRSGRHPLQAWDGELPGTLPMVAGTGEAPCEITQYDGQLWVASWGHHRIETFQLKPFGASFRAQRSTVVQGDESFRPVAFAHAPDGSLFVTDWVNRSYPVHGQGRVWRITPRNVKKGEQTKNSWPPLTDDERRARVSASRIRWENLESQDPFLHQAAVANLVASEELESIRFESLQHPRHRLGYLAALRWSLDHQRAESKRPPLSLLKQALADPDSDVRLFAVRWAADEGIRELRDAIAGQLREASESSPELVRASIASLELLETGKTSFDPKHTAQYFVDILKNPEQPSSVKLIALRNIPRDHESMTPEWLHEILNNSDARLRREAVRSIVASDRPERDRMLSEVARDRDFDSELRADAVSGLARNFKKNAAILKELANDSAPSVRQTVERIMERRKRLQTAAPQKLTADTSEWAERLSTGGDPAAGWRVFFDSTGVRCADCHRFQGRGASTGPELTGIVKRSSRQRVLESILDPSREMAPQYVPTLIQTSDGQVIQGLWQGYNVRSRMDRYQLADGSIREIDPILVEASRASDVSIMPEGFHQQLSAEEIRDLLALLSLEN